ncbi:polysaccharide deacetylase family protein [Vibrio sp. C8]
MIVCTLPPQCFNEASYIVNFLFKRLLGYQPVINMTDYENSEITFTLNRKTLKISNDFFRFSEIHWLTKRPPIEFSEYKGDGLTGLRTRTLPVIFGSPKITETSNEVHCQIDICGTVFYMLSRYEEALPEVELDLHGRFASTSSIAHKYGFLERPIVDEYIELFFVMIHRLWPDVKKVETHPRTFVTCDLDWPFDPVQRSFQKTLKSMASELIRQHSPKLALVRLKNFLGYNLGFNTIDSVRNNIDWIMDVNEQQGNKVAFYFITEYTHYLDSDFDFDSCEIRSLLRTISKRGHEIGIHPGFDCYRNPELFKRSVDTLRRVITEEGIMQPNIGCRMHFLRWDAKVTPKLCEDNGLVYDTTLSFADASGFRCGTCHAFPMYDLINRMPLNVIQRPLINMECTILDTRYEGLGYSQGALDRFDEFKQKVIYHNGEYVLLWHNTHFSHSADKAFYESLIQ